MAAARHQQLKYRQDNTYDNSIDPVTKLPFKLDEGVVACQEKNSLISLRSLQANGNQCPFCLRQVDSSLLMSKAKTDENSTKTPTPGLSTSRSRAPKIGWVRWLIGISSIACFAFFIVSVVFLSDSGGNPSNGAGIDASPTSSSMIVPPKPTTLPVTRRATTNTIESDLSQCGEISSVNVRDTSKGDVLIIACSNELTYQLDPLAKGKHVIAPNGSFIVYVTNDGYVYAASAGNKLLRNIGQFTDFHILEISGAPKLEISISGDDPYTVRVYEENGNESRNFPVPEDIAN